MLFYSFYKAWKTDPGTITATHGERKRVSQLYHLQQFTCTRDFIASFVFLPMRMLEYKRNFFLKLVTAFINFIDFNHNLETH